MFMPKAGAYSSAIQKTAMMTCSCFGFGVSLKHASAWPGVGAVMLPH